MMARLPPPPPLLFISFLFSLLTLSSSSTTADITLSLTPFLPNHPGSSSSSVSAAASDDNSSWQSQMLNLLAASSLTRARHLKKHNASSSSSNTTKVPFSPRSYGGYSIDLGFGTPAQTLAFVMDTGSSLLWFPCTSRYACTSCSFPKSDPSKIRRFIPKLSSSAKLVGCRNPKCAWIFGPAAASRCRDECVSGRNCSQQTCPPYLIQYGSGNTAGVLLSETLSLSKDRKVPGFLAGCSLFSTRQPAGIAGFGRGPESLPSQMGLRRFSYCLLSRRFDDTSASSDLVLEPGPGSGSGSGSGGDRKTNGVVYTPFRANPGLSGSAFKDYYYVSLHKVLVGGKAVKVPHRYLIPGADGNGGAIVDSGSTFTFMERPVFNAVAEELERQMANYSRAKGVEASTGLSPCFNVSGRGHKVAVPELSLQFKGGARMALPPENYVVLVGEGPGVVCVAIVTDDAAIGPEVSGGPAVILGSFQQQNFYIEYDLENERFGFKKQSCKVKRNP